MDLGKFLRKVFLVSSLAGFGLSSYSQKNCDFSKKGLGELKKTEINFNTGNDQFGHGLFAFMKNKIKNFYGEDRNGDTFNGDLGIKFEFVHGAELESSIDSKLIVMETSKEFRNSFFPKSMNNQNYAPLFGLTSSEISLSAKSNKNQRGIYQKGSIGYHLLQFGESYMGTIMKEWHKMSGARVPEFILDGNQSSIFLEYTLGLEKSKRISRNLNFILKSEIPIRPYFGLNYKFVEKYGEETFFQKKGESLWESFLYFSKIGFKGNIAIEIGLEEKNPKASLELFAKYFQHVPLNIEENLPKTIRKEDFGYTNSSKEFGGIIEIKLKENSNYNFYGYLGMEINKTRLNSITKKENEPNYIFGLKINLLKR
ncbi:MAG: hypothetical protein KC516_03860 [Nanoarchaeota archaeon]|nr:hypothetical protein [Nanoarchaeota archaeon]